MTAMNLLVPYVLVKGAKRIPHIKPNLLLKSGEGRLNFWGSWGACPCQLRAPGLFQGQRQKRNGSNFQVPCAKCGEILDVDESI